MARVVTIPIGPIFSGGSCRGMIHVVEQGDTLYFLGRRYNVSVSDIMYSNPYVNVYNLQVGDELCIPVASQQGNQENMMPGGGMPMPGGQMPGGGMQMPGGQMPGGGVQMPGGQMPGGGMPMPGGQMPGGGMPMPGGQMPGGGMPMPGDQMPGRRMQETMPMTESKMSETMDIAEEEI